MSKSIQLGSVVLVELCDPRGQNPKVRPALVLNKPPEILAGEDLRVAAISTDFSLPLRSGWFFATSDVQGAACTGLEEACVIKADWLDVVPQSKVIAVKGRETRQVVRSVLNWLTEQARRTRKS